MFCHRCGKEIEDSSAFCSYCGTKMPLDDSKVNHSDQDAAKETQNSGNSLDNNLDNNTVFEVSPNSSSLVSNNTDDKVEEKESSQTKNMVVVKQPKEPYTKTVSSESKSWTNRSSKTGNFGTLSNSKFYHDVYMNLGKSTIVCIIAILLVVLLSVCLFKCSNRDDDTVHITNSLFKDSAERTTPNSYENNEERWDAENCVYSNFKYGVAFTLPKNMAWHKVSGTAKHTVVKFVQPDTQLTLFVNISPFEGATKVSDIWDVYEEYTNTILEVVKNKVNSISAEQIEDYYFKKAEFCGNHAIKTRYSSIFGDDRHDEKKRIITIDYTFLYNKSTTTVTVKCYDEIMDLFINQGFTMEDFLKSFQLTPISK